MCTLGVVLGVCLRIVSHVPAQFSYHVVHFVLKCETILGFDVEGGRGEWRAERSLDQEG
jgi:hypothetical protein